MKLTKQQLKRLIKEQIDDMSSEFEMIEHIKSKGYEIAGEDFRASPFVDDGIIRIYQPDTLRVIGQGKTLEEAYEEWELWHDSGRAR